MNKRVFMAIVSVLIFSMLFFSCTKDSGYRLVESMPSVYTQGVKMGPYLQAVTADSVYVLVECDSEYPVLAEYGDTNAYGNSANTESTESTNGGSYIHNVKLTGLSAGNYYHYRITRNAGVSDDYVFRAAVAPGTPFKFAWASDFHDGKTVHEKISQKIMDAAPDFSIYGGDISTFGTYVNIKENFFVSRELQLSSTVPFMFTVGNHEGWTSVSRAFYQSPVQNADYYSFDYGDMHVLVLDSGADLSQGSSQYNFAAADLASSSAAWKIVSVHQPAYWAGGIDYPPHDTAGLRALADNVYKPNGVSMILSGHFHYYQHNLVDGIHHMIIATAGGELDMASTDTFTVKSNSTYCYGIVDVDSVSLTLNVYNENGATVDGFSLNH